MKEHYKVAILGASGYTGAELVRILSNHPGFEIVALTADRKAGQAMGAVFPHLSYLNLPNFITIDAIDWSHVDLAFAALPHGVTQNLSASAQKDVRSLILAQTQFAWLYMMGFCEPPFLFAMKKLCVVLVATCQATVALTQRR